MKTHCSYSELLDTAYLDTIRHPKNPKTHGAAQVAAIAAVFEGTGIRSPIVVSRLSNRIIKGHGRLDAALLLGYEKFPIDWQDYANEQEEIADMLADNRLADLGEIDDAKLLEVLSELQAVGHDINLTGFTEADVAALGAGAEVADQLQTIPRMEMQPFEHYDYLCFMFRDIRDWLRVLQLLKVVKVDFSITRKSQKIGIGRVINGKTLLGQLENPARHHVEGPRAEDHHAPADSTGDDSRSGG